MNRVQVFFLLSIVLILTGGPALADTYGTINYGALGVADTTRVDNVTQLTLNQYDDDAQCWGAYPWSSDGSMIAYTAQIGDSGSEFKEICIMDNTGSGWQRLTENDTCDSHPSFTPDGSKIVFQREIDDFAEIWIMDADGSNQTSLTQAHGGAVGGVESCENKPVVSPDGTMIAFHTCGDYIYVMDIDGTDPVQLPISDASHHTWSPDSQWVLLSADPTGDSSRVFRVHPDGTGIEALTDEVAGVCANWAFWSPDGDYIAFHTRDQRGDDDVHTLSIMHPDGTNKEALVTETDNDSGWDTICGPKSWSPDSEWIAFKKRSDASISSIFVFNLSSRAIYQLTENHNDQRLWWSPNNTQILFREWDYGPLRDGGQYDNDLLVVNLDAAYFPEIGNAPSTPIPTLSEWGMIFLSILLAASAMIIMRRKASA